jgi:hypothetical protein
MNLRLQGDLLLQSLNTRRDLGPDRSAQAQRSRHQDQRHRDGRAFHQDEAALHRAWLRRQYGSCRQRAFCLLSLWENHTSAWRK